MASMLQAPPSRKLYERLQRESRLLPQISGDNVDVSINIIPKMDLETLWKRYENIMGHTYLPDHFY